MLQKVLDLVRLDFAPYHQQPSNGRVVLATVLSIVGSLAADALLVVIAQALWPSTIQGQPARAVGTLFVMHVAIALVTYSALVYLAPVRVLRRPSHRAPQRVGR